jgi:hypothetical protein
MNFPHSFLFSRDLRRRTTPFTRLGLFLCFMCALAPFSFAQTPGGSIIGTVTEKHAGPLAGARVSVSNARTGFTDQRVNRRERSIHRGKPACWARTRSRSRPTAW